MAGSYFNFFYTDQDPVGKVWPLYPWMLIALKCPQSDLNLLLIEICSNNIYILNNVLHLGLLDTVYVSLMKSHPVLPLPKHSPFLLLSFQCQFCMSMLISSHSFPSQTYGFFFFCFFFCIKIHLPCFTPLTYCVYFFAPLFTIFVVSYFP